MVQKKSYEYLIEQVKHNEIEDVESFSNYILKYGNHLQERFQNSKFLETRQLAMKDYWDHLHFCIQYFTIVADWPRVLIFQRECIHLQESCYFFEDTYINDLKLLCKRWAEHGDLCMEHHYYQNASKAYAEAVKLLQAFQPSLEWSEREVANDLMKQWLLKKAESLHKENNYSK